MEKNVVAYYRTSSQSNVGGDKDSLKRQQNSVITYTKSNGMKVIKDFYDKGVSGSTDDCCNILCDKIKSNPNNQPPLFNSSSG